MKMSQNIQVAVRCRPLNDKEKKSNSFSVIESNERRREIVAIDRNSSVANTKTFTFDKVFGCESRQIDVYNQVVRPIVNEVIQGYNCTIFAYGQTGTGKTFTMEGEYSTIKEDISWENDPLVGIIPRSVAQLFSLLSSMSNCEHSVKVSYMELYNEELTDLLSDSILDGDQKLKIYDDPSRKGSVIVSKLEEVIVQNKSQAGAERRQKAATLMNAQSSRSHSLFTLTVFLKDKAIEGEETIKVGKLNLVDLAGSENIERSGATGKRAAEAGKINRSLTTLGRVITALVQHSDHVPYRESNLTRLLQDSLGGKTKTTIIATISPALCNLEETLSTLDYAHKAKSIRNKPEINQKLVKKELLKEYNEEIERLKRELNATREKNGMYLPPEIYQEMEANTNMLKMEIRDCNKKLAICSEELDKKNEENIKLQEELEEKKSCLYTTEEMYSKVKNKLETFEESVNELKFLVTERFKAEETLAKKAETLLHQNTQFEADNSSLHEKISKVLSINDKNRTLVKEFTNYVTETISNLSVKEHEILSLSKQKYGSLNEMLKELNTNIRNQSEDKLQLLDMFDDKLKSWVESQSSLVEKELESCIRTHYEGFAKKLNAQSLSFANSCDEILKECQEHKDNYNKIWSKMTCSVKEMTTEVSNFDSKFTNTANEFLVSTNKDSNDTNSKLISKITHVGDSIEEHKIHLNKMLDFKQSVRSELNEIQGQLELIVNMTKNMSNRLEQFDGICDKLIKISEVQSNELNELKETLKANENNRIKKLNSEFEAKINQPVKGLVMNNSKTLIELNVLTKTLNEKNEAQNAYFCNSIEGFKMLRDEELNDSHQSFSKEFDKLEKNCKKIQANLTEYQTDTTKFFDEFQSQISHDCNNYIQIMGESIGLVEDTKLHSESLVDINREYCNKLTRKVVKLTNEEFRSYMPTGQSPKPREKTALIEIKNPKTDQAILEIYRQNFATNIGDLTNNTFITPTISDSMIVSADSASSVLPSIETNRPILKINEVSTHGYKRNIPDKENFPDLGEKASKYKRLLSSSRLGSKRPFQD